jgi:hypothetical protein
MKLFLILPLLLTACAGQKLKPEQIQEVKEISILSLIPEEIRIHNVGTTIFQNEEGNYPLAKLGQNMIEQNKKLLTGIAVKPFTYDTNKYQQWKKERTSGVGGFLSMPNEVGFTKEYFLPLAESAGVKYLAVFAPIRHDNYALYPGGFGVICRSAFGISGKASSYALYSGHLWDVQKKESIYFEYFTPNTTNKESKLNCDELAKMKPEQIQKTFANELLETQSSTLDSFWQRSGLRKN